ncbi:integrase core domain-containing protein [Streptomyces sp. NPDC055239]
MHPTAQQTLRSVRDECTNRILVYDPSHAEKILHDYAKHYNDHRPHQGHNQLAPRDDPDVIPLPTPRIQRHQAVGSLINEYHRAS